MSTRVRFFAKIMDAKSALNAVSEELNHAALGSVNELSIYVVFGPGTTGGSVQVESAHQDGYTGTWAAEGSAVNWAAANRVHKVSIAGASFVSRARISSAILNGTVDVWAVANG